MAHHHAAVTLVEAVRMLSGVSMGDAPCLMSRLRVADYYTSGLHRRRGRLLSALPTHTISVEPCMPKTGTLSDGEPVPCCWAVLDGTVDGWLRPRGGAVVYIGDDRDFGPPVACDMGATNSVVLLKYTPLVPPPWFRSTFYPGIQAPPPPRLDVV